MNLLKKYLISIGISFLALIFGILIITIFDYFEVLKEPTLNILKYMLYFISFLIGGFYLGRKTAKKGYQNGIILGIIVSSICFFLSLILKMFSLSFLLLAIIIIIFSMLGAMFGINKKNIE